MKVPDHVVFRNELSLVLWQPHGILDEESVSEIVAFIETAERRMPRPFHRFTDMSALDMVDLNFQFVFRVGIFRRISAAPKPRVKSAFYVTSPPTEHYAKLHAMLTDHSPLEVCLFKDRDEAAKWLEVPVDALSMD